MSIQQNGTNGQRLTQRDLDELWRDYCRAMDCADEAIGKPWQAQLARYAEEKEQMYMAARFMNGYSWAGREKVTQ